MKFQYCTMANIVMVLIIFLGYIIYHTESEKLASSLTSPSSTALEEVRTAKQLQSASASSTSITTSGNM